MRKSIQLRDYEVRSLERNRSAKIIRVMSRYQTSHAAGNQPILAETVMMVVDSKNKVITGTQVPFLVGQIVNIAEPVQIVEVPVLDKHRVEISLGPVNVISYKDNRVRPLEPIDKAVYWDNIWFRRYGSKPKTTPIKNFKSAYNRFTCEVTNLEIGRLQDFTKYHDEAFNLKNYEIGNYPAWGEPTPRENWHPMCQLSKCPHTLDKACADRWNRHTKQKWLQYDADPIVYCYTLKLIQDANDYLRPVER